MKDPKKTENPRERDYPKIPIADLPEKYIELREWIAETFGLSHGNQHLVHAVILPDHVHGEIVKVRWYTEDCGFCVVAIAPCETTMHGYLGGFGNSRKPRAGEIHCRGNDLPGGGYNKQTWNNIIHKAMWFATVPLEIPFETKTPRERVRAGAIAIFRNPSEIFEKVRSLCNDLSRGLPPSAEKGFGTFKMGEIIGGIIANVKNPEENFPLPSTDAYTHSAILEFFDYNHLPDDLQAISAKFFLLAHSLDFSLHGQGLDGLREKMLRLLLEAKDCFVRAAVSAKKRIGSSSLFVAPSPQPNSEGKEEAKIETEDEVKDSPIFALCVPPPDDNESNG